MKNPLKMKPGDLVKYNSAAASSTSASASAFVRSSAASHCYWNLSWSWDEVANLIGIVLETKENKRVKIRWFGINKTFIEYERYLEIVK